MIMMWETGLNLEKDEQQGDKWRSEKPKDPVRAADSPRVAETPFTTVRVFSEHPNFLNSSAGSNIHGSLAFGFR